MLDLNCLMRPRKVCLCRSVTRDDIKHAVESGVRTMNQLQAKTAASTGCGTCFLEVKNVLEEELLCFQEKNDRQCRLKFSEPSS